jgi:polyisoprenoid-binding protein YceI
MKTRSSNLINSCSAAIAAIALLSSTASSRAGEMLKYRAKPVGNKVHIDGSANVHDWDMDGTLVGGFFEVPATVMLDSTQGEIAGVGDGKIAATAEVSIPVSSLINSKYEGMSEVMLQAMNAKEHPRIVFILTEFTIKQPHTANNPIECDTKGNLVINGITNAVAFPVKIESVDKTTLKISASGIIVKMPDYKVPPPVKMGIFKTEPDVKIMFEWLVHLSAKAPTAK